MTPTSSMLPILRERLRTSRNRVAFRDSKEYQSHIAFSGYTILNFTQQQDQDLTYLALLDLTWLQYLRNVFQVEYKAGLLLFISCLGIGELPRVVSIE